MTNTSTNSSSTYPNTGSVDKMPGCDSDADDATETSTEPVAPANPAKEFGGPKGPEPTRYGDWEKNGRCIDF
tara:strand:+ start:417 stop:632 length:216 start_codon:yes stop_codon:yes gene_type:complete